MQIREIVFLPTGEVFADESYDTVELEQYIVTDYEQWWRERVSPAIGGVDTPSGRLDFRFTYASEGHGLATFTLNQTPVFSLALLSGKNPGEEAELLEMYLSSMRNVEHVKTLAKAPLPFESIRALETRPLVANVFWPVVPPEQSEELFGIASYVTAAFFQACGNPGV